MIWSGVTALKLVKLDTKIAGYVYMIYLFFIVEYVSLYHTNRVLGVLVNANLKIQFHHPNK
jgi:hypothetical protein